MNKNMKRAFTITELVIVIAVVAILAAVLIPTFSNLIEKANVSNDTVLVRNLNEALIIAETTEGKPATMHDALTAVAEQGYSVEKLTPRSTGDILWEQTSNRFALVKDNEIVFGDDTTKAEIGYTYWEIVKERPTENTNNYSLYLADGFATEGALPVSSGVDVGNNSNIAINYNNPNDEQNVIIRTQGGKLSINGLEDTVSHYGTANSVEITAIKDESYHEYGTILGNISLEQGRVVLENKSEVSSVVVTATSLTNIAIEDKSGNNTTVAATNDTVAGQLATSDKISGTTNVQETVVDEAQMSLFAGGIGTEASPYLIGSEKQLSNINTLGEDMKSGSYYYFKMISNIVVTNEYKVNYGDEAIVRYFRGSFDGNGYDLEVNATHSQITDTTWFTVFATVYANSEEETIFKNINIYWLDGDPAWISMTAETSGAGYVVFDSINMYNSGECFNTRGNNNGALSGFVNSNARVLNCNNYANMSIGGVSAVWFGEVCNPTSRIEFTNVNNYGRITGSGFAYFNGNSSVLNGYDTTDLSKIFSVTNCYNYGTLLKFSSKGVTMFGGVNKAAGDLEFDESVKTELGKGGGVCSNITPSGNITYTVGENNKLTISDNSNQTSAIRVEYSSHYSSASTGQNGGFKLTMYVSEHSEYLYKAKFATVTDGNYDGYTVIKEISADVAGVPFAICLKDGQTYFVINNLYEYLLFADAKDVTLGGTTITAFGTNSEGLDIDFCEIK